MHPINKKSFGPGVGKLSIDFHNGTAVVTGYIVKQSGTKRFVATVDGTTTYVVTLAPTLDIATALTAGYATIKVTPASGPVEHVGSIQATKVVTLEGNTYRWTLGAAAAPDLVALATVAPVVALAITGTPAAGKVGTAYTFTPVVTGGTGTKTFTMTGTLPAGLTFDTTSGAVTGTPSAVATNSVSITVTDSSGSATLSNASFAVTA